ncbi:MAG: hypothetical protein L6Q49_20830 [Anaerolineales bacterium]|nr:hypothetical protein [Anaerolineales bacterium]
MILNHLTQVQNSIIALLWTGISLLLVTSIHTLIKERLPQITCTIGWNG